MTFATTFVVAVARVLHVYVGCIAFGAHQLAPARFRLKFLEKGAKPDFFLSEASTTAVVATKVSLYGY